MTTTVSRPPLALAPLLDACRTRHALVVGDVMVDEYVDGACERVSPEAPVPVVQVRGTRALLGGAGNTAANVAALGGRCTLVGRLGRDDAAGVVRQLAAQHGITRSCIFMGAAR